MNIIIIDNNNIVFSYIYDLCLLLMKYKGDMIPDKSLWDNIWITFEICWFLHILYWYILIKWLVKRWVYAKEMLQYCNGITSVSLTQFHGLRTSLQIS